MPRLASRQQTLIQKRLELEDRLSRIHRDRSRAAGALEADFAEQAAQVENDEVLDRLDASTRAELGAVRHALERIELGVGEDCENCGARIDQPRLSAVPQATLCRRCAGIAAAAGGARRGAPD